MKANLALLLLTVAAFILKGCYGHDEIVKARDCSGGDGTYPDPSFCEMFYQCVNGVALSFSCPRTTVFNPNTALCDSQFICEFKCPLEDGIYSDPKNCEKFFFCRDRTVIEMRCPEESPVFNHELRVCDTRSNYPCGHAPDHGGWSNWSGWSNCSLACGNGTSMRVRTCDNPNPVNGGNECQGPANETQMCNTHHCPVDGAWGAWTAWGTCSTTCGDGTHSRTKSCDSPAPAYGGQNCSGQGTESRRCNLKPCPVNGGWGAWGNWSNCSATCGDGTQIRSKPCDTPAPAYGGKNCSGNGTESRSCNLKPCCKEQKWTWNYVGFEKDSQGGAKDMTILSVLIGYYSATKCSTECKKTEKCQFYATSESGKGSCTLYALKKGADVNLIAAGVYTDHGEFDEYDKVGKICP